MYRIVFIADVIQALKSKQIEKQTLGKQLLLLWDFLSEDISYIGSIKGAELKLFSTGEGCFMFSQ